TSKWVDDGIYLLASQSVDKCQSHEGAELALQELEHYLDNAGQNQLTDLSVIWKEYEEVLNQQFREMFDKRRISLKKLAAKQTRPVQPVAPRPEAFIKSPLSSPVRSHTMMLVMICHGFDTMTDLQIYEKYCHNKPRSESLWRQCSDCAFFQECQKKLEHKLGLDSYLLKPVQRITKYQLLLKVRTDFCLFGNNRLSLCHSFELEGNLSELGKLLMQGSFSVWTEHKKGHAKVKDLARFKPMQRHLFLHEKALLFCKRREENGEGYEKAPSYSFKQSQPAEGTRPSVSVSSSTNWNSKSQ
ncbi:hypothetical protein XENOCAPTIV_012253, partial [Xenoophorus captivus]